MRRAVLLFNPCAGGRRGGRALAAVTALLAREFALEVVPSGDLAAHRGAARAAAAAGFDVLFALGGDGTLRLAAGELAGSATALGALPGGTTNVVCGALGLSRRDPVAAARALVRAEARWCDLGRIGPEAFLMQASGGLDAAALAGVDAAAKRRWGRLAVAGAGLEAWRGYGFPPFELEIDGERVTATGFVLANLARYAGAFEILPGARPDDGRLDLLLFHGRHRRAALGFALDLARGRHLARADVERRPLAGRLRLLGPTPAALQADGDPLALAAPLELGLDAARLRLLVPS